MKEWFDISSRGNILRTRQGVTIPSGKFKGLIVDSKIGFVYVAGDMNSPQYAQLDRGHLFVDGAIGSNVAITSKWFNKNEPLSVLGAWKLKANAAPDVPILIFGKADMADPEMARTLRGIPHVTLLVQTDKPRELFDACMMDRASLVPGEKGMRMKAEDVVLQAQQTLRGLGEAVEIKFLDDNLHRVHYPYRKELYVSSSSLAKAAPTNGQVPLGPCSAP